MVTIPTSKGEMFARFPAEGSSAAEARRFVSQAIFDGGCPELDEVARLLVSELVGNALLHAGGEFELRIRILADRVRVEVQDGSPRLPDRKYYSRTSATGRGLMLVEELSRAWGARRIKGGKVVWFELDQTSRLGE